MEREEDLGTTPVSPAVGTSPEAGAAAQKPTLDQVLDDAEAASHKLMPFCHEQRDDELGAEPAKPGMCIECGDMQAEVFCEQCGDDFCRLCWTSTHRKGTRAQHKTRLLAGVVAHTPATATPARPAAEAEPEVADDGSLISPPPMVRSPAAMAPEGSNFVERAKWIPIRLSLQERKELRLVEAALNVSEYTDKIDVLSYHNPAKRMVVQLREVCAVLSGLVVASDYAAGQKLLKDRNFHEFDFFFKHMFELGRRHKIMNPEKMRATYGKLIYLLQDSQIPEVEEMLQFSMVKPIVTVYALFEHYGLGSLLVDPVLPLATMEIMEQGKSRYQVQRDIKQKEAAIEALARKYGTDKFPPDSVRTCLYSIGDNNAFLRGACDPCEKMLGYLRRYFSPDREEPGFSLSISFGQEGARLTHDHSRQYHYVEQSMYLWREVTHDMFRLWCLAETDLLDSRNPYRLRDTGQGLNRMQGAPRTEQAMHQILHRAMTELGSWVGSSVVHMGDTNVPNALMFIDKYTQVPRILNPVVHCLECLDKLAESPAMRRYIESAFVSVDHLRKMILQDFFRHGFDGSGADNFFSAGSCIDGRLTSAWEWCNSLEKKPYFPVFLLTGFIGFDGQF
ncbi:putative UPF0652 protein [Paratrimastix pyriformis]|uniref:UPF0652 protein n=1 Tax=Paratrimastix pyriformis TaxID=342808 RepID=A0ABQ8UL75_9EUKA|nr:putative UPF0652 protein [Paratrimastix pyriformis]